MDGCPQVVVNALALFWVTDSISERSAAGPRSGATGTMDHPVYEMSSERSHKDTNTSVRDMVSTSRPRQQSRQSWSPFAALDRSFRVLFVREPECRETGTVDVEVSVHSLIKFLHDHQGGKFRSLSTLRRTSTFLLFTKLPKSTRRKERPKQSSLPSTIHASSGCRWMSKSSFLYHSIRHVHSPGVQPSWNVYPVRSILVEA